MIEHTIGVDWTTIGQAIVVGIVAGILNAAILAWILKMLTVNPKQR